MTKQLQTALYVWRFRYLNPDEILNRPNVHLLGVDGAKAFFSVTDENEDLYDVRVNHFLYETTFFESTRLILVPLDHFEELGRRCGDPEPGSATLLCGTGR